jgi:non-specific serine/threonine protein kinase
LPDHVPGGDALVPVDGREDPPPGQDGLPPALRLLPDPDPETSDVAGLADALPRPPNGLIGRAREVEAAVALLGDEGGRWLTLIGAGGVGKTRLALEVARRLADAFAAGGFVDLSPVAAADAVPDAVAQSLDIGGEPALAAADRLRDHIGARSFLLVLDNVEHVAAAAPFVAALLAACPGLAVLATSRVPLRVDEETLLPVEPLEAPPVGAGDLPLPRLLGFPAVRLFAERAAAADPGFTLDLARGTVIAGICRQLDGLPLAIELAAARVRVLSPVELAERLGRRLPLLAAPTADGPARQRTLRAAIAWSYDLLSADEQALFRRLALFLDGATLAAVEASAPPALPGMPAPASERSPIDLLHGLIDASLLRRTEDADGTSRFRMLETIREFGLEQLAASGDETAARDAHAAWCLALAERAEPELAGPDQERWLRAIEAELPNIRAAHRWLREAGDLERGLRLAGAVGWVWSSSGYFREGQALFADLVADPAAGAFPAPLSKALTSAADIESWLGNPRQAENLYLQALALARAGNDRERVVALVRGLGTIALDRDDLDRAERLLTEARDLAERAGQPWGVAAAVNLLGVAAVGRGDGRRAMALHEAAREGWRALGDSGHEAVALSSGGLAAVVAGDIRRAAAAYADAMAMVMEDDEVGLARILMGAGGIAAAVGDFDRAARLFAAAGAAEARQGTPPFPATARWRDGCIERVRRALGDRAFAAASAAGAAASLAAAGAEAAALFAAAAGDGPARPDDPGTRFGLTAREREVLRLVAAGRADKEIAASLGISRATASKHVSSILTKLGVSSRTAAVAAIGRHGLV